MTAPVIHSRAAILSIGDELTLGQKLDTNSQWLSQQLVSRGIIVAEHVTVPDDLDQHVAALRRLASIYPLIISTGGLGPTLDDLTRSALAALLNEPLIEDPGALSRIRAIMEKRGRELSDLQRTQALRPQSAHMMKNPVGSAPGIRAAFVACDIFCLPGPPGEMKPMFERFVAPALRPPPGRTILTRTLHCLGIGEGDLATRLGPLMERTRNPTVGTTASGGVVSIRIRYESTPDAEAEESATKPRVITHTPPSLENTLRAARTAAGPFLFSENDEPIEAVVLNLLRARNEKLILAESCTGGGLGELFTRTPGSSAALLGGWIVYSNEMKTAALGVPAELIAQHGAVSEQVARAMAEGALQAGGIGRAAFQGRHPQAHHALAITGIAGPDGNTATKPVGTVFIASASLSTVNRARQEAGSSAGTLPSAPTTEVRRFLITGDREDIRDRSARLALAMLRWRLLDATVPRCLWQLQLDGSPFRSP